MRRFLRRLSIWTLLAALVGCVPVRGGPPDMSDVEAHLGLVVGHVPAGCDPVGLSGDGRGTMVGAGFECPDGTSFRIERFGAAVVEDEELTPQPSETAPDRVGWRDEVTGDEIRVASDDLEIDALLVIAEAIEFP